MKKKTIIILLLLFSCKAEKIIDPPVELNKTIKLLTPTGGESFLTTDTLNINWHSANISQINILYNYDGSSWQDTVYKVDASLNSYQIEPPLRACDSCLIKIAAINDTNIYDVSGTTFSIVTPVEPVLEYFPLEIGNIYVYSVEESTYPNWQPEKWNERVTIVDKITFNGLEYYDFKTETSNMISSHSYYRIDESSQTIYKYNDYAPNTDYLIAQLSLSDGLHSLPGMKTVDVNTSEQTIFGTSDSVKSFDFHDTYSNWKYDFAKGFGVFNKWESNESFEINRTLSGAEINNEIYGDTTLYPSDQIPTDSLKYYPLTTGDYYIFADTLIKWGQADLITKVKKEIIDEVSIDNQLYYKIVEINSEDSNSSNLYYERVSEDGKIYRIDGNIVRIIDDLSTELNDKNYFYRYGFYEGWTSYNKFESYSLVNINGTNYYRRNYYTIAGGEFDAQYSLLYNFGLYQYKVNNGNDASIRKGKLIGGKNNNINWGQYQFP